MRLVFRRARAATGLLLAAVGATLVTTVLLTGLASYSRGVVAAGAASAVAAAPPEERSVLLEGPAGAPAVLARRDAALRAHLAGGFAGLASDVWASGTAAGRQLGPATGAAAPGPDGAVLGSVVFLDGLAQHADLVGGAWPRPGGTPVQAALAERVAGILGLAVGDRIPVTNRFTGTVDDVTVAAIWRPRQPAAGYWRLVPTVATGVAPQSSMYGPIVVPREDFLARFAASASAAWLVEPHPAGLRPGRTDPRQVTQAADGLPAAVGFDTSAVATTGLDRLTDRLRRADLVGRSALLTPMLLMLVLGGYALLLIALLLGEDRRGETALLRARGAGRGQLAGLAAREAALLAVPAAVLAPVLATVALRYADRSLAPTRDVPRLDGVLWLVAGIAAAVCAVALLLPALRASGSYVAELGSRSRPNRRSAVQRAGVDLALVALAVLAWTQLRQYAGPLANVRGGAAGIDPLLAAAPTLAVLAGAVVALRVVTPLTRLAERYVAGKPWTAAVLGTWQASRRPHAGPVLLLCLAIAVSTLAWCLAGTARRSVVDQADQQVGADLRLVETSWFPLAGRAEAVAALPGITATLPAWRQSLRLGPAATPADLMAVDTGRAGPVLRLRDDMTRRPPAEVLAGLASARISPPGLDLPAGARRLTGELRAGTAARPVRTAAVFALPDGTYRRAPLGVPDDGGLRFAVDIPTGAAPPRLAGFVVDTAVPVGEPLTWQVSGLRADATRLDLRSAEQWHGHNGRGVRANLRAGGDELAIRYVGVAVDYLAAEPVQLVIAPPAPDTPVPMLASPAALAGLRLNAGERSRLPIGPGPVGVQVADTITAVPGVSEAAGLLVDLPSLSTALFHGYGMLPEPQEWWVATAADGHRDAALAAGRLGGFQLHDRRSVAEFAAREPYGVGARVALFAAALGAVLLAAVGLTVDVRATARRRATELAVLHTLGAGPRLLARSLVTEHGFLAAVGVLGGVAVGIAVAAATAPLVVLTPAGARPVPSALLAVPWGQVLLSAAALLALTAVLAAAVAATLRSRLAANRLRIGADT